MAIATLFNVQIPGFNYLPTRRNCRNWMLEKKLRSILMKIIQSRLASEGGEYGNDLLGLTLKGCISTEQGGKQEKLRLSVDEIMHECKTFFFAGHETTSILLAWTVFLLCVHPEWQERLREEVLRECGNATPNANDLGKLKEMTMVLLECLRLYCPLLHLLRKAETDMTLGGIKVPKGVGLVIPIPSMHRNKEVWGEDAEEFNPSRFQNGITSAAKVPYALLAFSAGPRSCIGQNFAILEAKSIMVKILQKFSFTLSPSDDE